jgi:ubiquinone/menaquinone biosynthesis C-methylase UbiE
MILDALVLTGDEQIADIGGGTGQYAIALSHHCRQVTVVDESQAMLAQVPPHEKIRVLHGDALQTNLDDASFDLVLLSAVIHHIPQQDQVLREAHRILKPGGRIVIHDFNANSRRIRLLSHLERLYLGPIAFRTLDEMIADTKHGILLDNTKSWSIDDLRLNFQFSTELGWLIEDGSITGMVRNPSYQGITPQFWNSCDAVANRDEWRMWGVLNCGKGDPMQVMHVGHGASRARFRNVRVGIK